MKPLRISAFNKVLLLAAPLALALAGTPAAGHGGGGHGHGHGAHAGDGGMPSSLQARDCWVRPLPQKLPAAAYMRLANPGGHAVTVTGAQAPGFGRVMLHKTEMREGMTSMAHVHALEVPAGQEVELAPGGFHIMLEKPQRTLAAGQSVEVTLSVKDAAPLTVACEVKTSSTLE